MQRFYRQLMTEAGLTAVLIAALVAGLLYFGGRISNSTVRIRDLRQELVVRWSSLSSLANLLTDYNVTARQNLVVLERTVPKRDAIFNLGRDLRSVGAKSPVDQTYAFISETPGAGDSLGFVTFQRGVSGAFDDLLTHLAALGRFSYLSRIETANIERKEPKSALSLRGRVFFQQP